MSEPGDSPPELLLGPMLRYAGSTESATFWLETSASCEVEILGRRTSTFAVEGHHYALLLVEELDPGSVTPYEVLAERRARLASRDERPRPVVRTRNHERHARLAFGSCRVGDPQPTNLGAEWPERHPGPRGRRALDVSRSSFSGGESNGLTRCSSSATRCTQTRSHRRRSHSSGKARDRTSRPASRWPTSRSTRASIGNPGGAGHPLAALDRAEHMIFDDHDVHDDWNISWLWVQEMRRTKPGGSRVIGAFMAYWLYQHLGNLSPPELEEDDDAIPQVEVAETPDRCFATCAHVADRESAASRWAYYRDFGRHATRRPGLSRRARAVGRSAAT